MLRFLMDSFLYFYMISGFYLFAGVRQIILGILAKWNVTNIVFGILVLYWAFYEFAIIGQYNSKSLDEYLIYFKLRWLAPSFGGILQMLFVSLYTKIFNKPFFLFVCVLSVVCFVLNLLLPYGLVFDEIKDFYIDKDIFSTPSAHMEGHASPFLAIHKIYIVLFKSYIFFVLFKYYKREKTKVAMVLIIVFGLRTFEFGLKTLFSLNVSFADFKILLSQIIDISGIALVLVITYILSCDLRNFNKIKLAISKDNELKMFKDRMILYMVNNLLEPIDRLCNTILTHSKEEIIVTAHSNSLKIFNQVVNILDVYKYGENRINLNVSDSNLNEIINCAKSILDSIHDQKNIVYELSDSNNYRVYVDWSLIERVFVNLLSISIGFQDENSTTTLSVEELNKITLKVYISNKGIVISNKWKNLFLGNESDRFYGFDYSNSLSLSYCQTIINAHGGKIGFNSDREDRITVWFTLDQSQINHDKKLPQ